jgi:hypothetical protein
MCEGKGVQVRSHILTTDTRMRLGPVVLSETSGEPKNNNLMMIYLSRYYLTESIGQYWLNNPWGTLWVAREICIGLWAFNLAAPRHDVAPHVGGFVAASLYPWGSNEAIR